MIFIVTVLQSCFPDAMMEKRVEFEVLGQYIYISHKICNVWGRIELQYIFFWQTRWTGCV